MGIFKRWKRTRKPSPEGDQSQEFSHASGATGLGDVLDQHDPKYDKDNPPPAPRGRAARLHPDAEKPERNPFEPT